ncbi:unnamed protein product, partial [marine sediment metagenome]
MTYPVEQVEYGTYLWLLREVGGALAFPHNYKTWDHDQRAKVDSIIQSGYMQMLHPVPLPVGGDEKAQAAHQWSFITPVAELPVVAGQHAYDLPD